MIISTTRLGTPCIRVQKPLAGPRSHLWRLRVSRHSPNPSTVPSAPENTPSSKVTSRPLRINFQRSSRRKVLSKLSFTPSQKLSSPSVSSRMANTAYSCR